MDKPISVGDLVQIVRRNSCGCSSAHLGRIFVVSAFTKSNGQCGQCGARIAVDSLAAQDKEESHRAQIWRLKRIPPLAELESEKNDSKLTEPA